MKLKTLREHYTSRDGLNWKPKRSFDTKDDITQFLGKAAEHRHFYTCGICFKYHIATYQPEN